MAALANEPFPHVLHLVDAMGSSHLWGKERAIAALMEAQRREGIAAALAVFSPNVLADTMRAAGFPTYVLGARQQRLPLVALSRLIGVLGRERRPVLHTHGYKANIAGRVLRLLGAPIARLIATVHGMNDETRALVLYNRLDRLTAPLSDVVAVTDARLPPTFPRRTQTIYVANGIPDRPPFDLGERQRARQRWRIPAEAFVVGLLGRVNVAKGTLEVFRAARDCADGRVMFAFAGDGELVDSSEAPSHVRFLGYVDEPETYLPALDVYLQASYTEGLSLALLESMRGGLPAVATDVGSTSRAIEDGRDGMLIAPRDPGAIARAVERLAGDEDLRSRLGRAARARFEADFSIERNARAYRELYAIGSVDDTAK